MLPPPLQLGLTVTASLCVTAVHCCQSMTFSNGPCMYEFSVTEMFFCHIEWNTNLELCWLIALNFHVSIISHICSIIGPEQS